jgi:hypothetical protein
LLWQRLLGTTVNPPGGGADGNGDGVVDAADLDLWRSQMGEPSEPRESLPRVYRPAKRTEHDLVGGLNSTIDVVLTEDLFADFARRPARDGFVVENREPFVFRPERRDVAFGVPTVIDGHAEARAVGLALPDEDSASLVLVDELFAGCEIEGLD